MCEWYGMVKIVGLCLRSRGIRINEYNLAADASHDESIGRCRAYKTATDDTDLHEFNGTSNL
jgi:hypothetical protein